MHALHPWLTSNSSWYTMLSAGVEWVHEQPEHTTHASFAQRQAPLASSGWWRLLSYSVEDLAELGVTVEDAEVLL